MPNRRPDSMTGYWLSTHPGLSGWPEDHVTTSDLSEGKRAADPSLPTRALLVIRDRLGFRYEREVGLANFVSRQEAAYLLGASLMSVGRWVRSKKLPSKMREVNGRKYSVVKVAHVWRLAKELNLPVPEGRRLTVIGAGDSGDDKRPRKRR